MSLESLLGNKTPATPAADGGLGPNKFQLQMFGPNATVAPRPTLGFGAPDLRSQVPAGASAPAVMPTTGGVDPKPDPYSGLGFLSGFFRNLDAMRVKNGMPAIADNPKMMEAFRRGIPPLGGGGA